MKLEVKQLSYSYPGEASVKALESVSFLLESGSEGFFLGIGGPNGSGKSTLLRAISGAIPTIGESIFWNDRPLSKYQKVELASIIGFIPTNLNFEFGIVARDFVLQGRYPHLKGFASPSIEDGKIADEIFETVGVEKLKGRNLREISTGERQLLCLARTLVQRPKILLLDEALSNLDLSFQRRILKILTDLIHCEVSVILVTHDLGLLGEFAPEILWLRRGQVFAHGKASAVYNTEIISELYSVTNQIEVRENPLTKRPHVFWR